MCGQYRVAALFFPGQDPTKRSSQGEQTMVLYLPEEAKDEGRSWWPDLDRASTEGGGRAGAYGATSSVR